MSSGKIGIFWFINGRVMGRARPTSEGEAHVAGMYDSPDAHAELWENADGLPGLDPALRGQPYSAFPRGRVLYRGGDQRFIVYMDRVLFTAKTQKAIAAFFDLPKNGVLWRADVHYTTDPDDLDRLFSE